MLVNKYNGYYERGKPFSPDKWLNIMMIYLSELDKSGKCTLRQLSEEAMISTTAASKAMQFAAEGVLIPLVASRGHGKSGVGSLKGLGIEHSEYLYTLYKANPALPLYGYCEEFRLKFGIIISEQLVLRWFNTAGRYKGSRRVCDQRPHKKYT